MEKKLAQNTTLKLKVTARRKVKNVNHSFVYILFLAP